MRRCLMPSQTQWKQTLLGLGVACWCATSAFAGPTPIDEPPIPSITGGDQLKGQSAKITVIVRNDQEEDDRDAADEKNTNEERASDKDGADNITVQVDAHAAPPRLWLGLALEPIDGGLARYLGHNHGVLIESVYPDSPAEKAELQEGDIIVAFDGQEIKAPETLLSTLRELSAKETNAQENKDEQAKASGGAVEIKVLRRGETKSLKITPAVRPENVKQPKNIEINVPELKEMAVRGGSIFKIGEPLVVPGLGVQKQRVISVLQNNDNGKLTEVQIESASDQPLKITVTDEKGTRELKPDELEGLPEKLRKAVQQALDRKSQSDQPRNPSTAKQAEKADAAAALAQSAIERVHQKLEETRKRVESKASSKPSDKSAELEVGKAAEKAAEKAADLESQIRQQIEQSLREFPRGNGIVVIAPEWAKDMQKSAEKMAQEGMKKAGQFAAMPDKIAELQEKIDKLQKQVEELTHKLEERSKPDGK